MPCSYYARPPTCRLADRRIHCCIHLFLTTGGVEIPVETEEDPICTYTDFKFAGYEGEQTCCAVECGTCESEGCEDRPGGPDACCPAIIDEFGDHCDNPNTEGAPCYLFEKFTDGDFEPVERELAGT